MSTNNTGTICPACGKTRLQKETRKSELYGFDLGNYHAEICGNCNEIFWKENDVKKMEMKAKKLGIWGLEQHTKIAVAGNSLIVRIPKNIARFVGMKKGRTVSLHPVGRDKLMIVDEERQNQFEE